MSYRRLPPLQSLIAFEASARLLSFKAAAQELYLTPPAVTYQIKELEGHLGLPLFKRTPKGLELTHQGSQYYQEIERSLASILKATQDVCAHNTRKQLRVQMLPFMATDIVIPKLSDFYEQYPDIDIQIDTKYAVADFQRENLDMAIRFGLGDWEGLACEKIMPASIRLICTQDYANSQQLNDLHDLTNATLVSLSNDKYNWKYFSKLASITNIQPTRELNFNDYTLCLRAAEQNMGVTFGIFPLVQQWLDAKRLVSPFDFSLSMPQAYYVCYQPHSEKLKEIKFFYDWLTQILPSSID